MLSEKFIRKYLRLAKQFGEDTNPCYARQIGAVIVHPEENRILSTGYNGPPKGTPHADSLEYLRDIVWPQLSSEERIKLNASSAIEFAQKHVNCHICPRRLLDIPSGQRLELCGCEHAEKNAIANASQNLHGSWMLIWGAGPCWDCTKLIINCGIKRLICTGKDYNRRSQWLLGHAKIPCEMRDPYSLDVIECLSHEEQIARGVQQ